ncbi:anti-anti-sigma factor [Streptomyces sp. NPDC048362]|uniref:anti-anti-sigma factor n=1 Tax=Streptomyces sp. NPDC048362 TaxID=3365539 RepID=UPI003716E617
MIASVRHGFIRAAPIQNRAGELNLLGQSVGRAGFIDGIRALTVSEEIDYETGEQLRQARSSPTLASHRFAVDLRQPPLWEARGINILLIAHCGTAEAGGWLRLTAPTGTV